MRNNIRRQVLVTVAVAALMLLGLGYAQTVPATAPTASAVATMTDTTLHAVPVTGGEVNYPMWAVPVALQTALSLFAPWLIGILNLGLGLFKITWKPIRQVLAIVISLATTVVVGILSHQFNIPLSPMSVTLLGLGGVGYMVYSYHNTWKPLWDSKKSAPASVSK
jgi:hypothetical protein